MGKKKTLPFSKMVCEALTIANDVKGMNAKMILDFIKKKHSFEGDDKTNINLIHKELERGKTANEYIQVQGNSVHGHFTFNMSYIPPNELQSNQLPDYLNPPEAPKEPIELPLQEPKKRRRQRREEIAASTSKTETPSSPAESPYVLIRYAPDGRVEKGTLDRHGNMKFTLDETMPYVSRAQANLIQRMQKKKKTEMSSEEASKLAKDPLFRRVFRQTESVNIDPKLQEAADKAHLQKSLNLLRGDKTDRIRLGVHSVAGDVDDQFLDEFNQMELQEANEANEVNEAESSSQATKRAPKTKEDFKQMTVHERASYVLNRLKSPNSKLHEKTMMDLNRLLRARKRLRDAFVEAGIIPLSIECISVNNPVLSNLVLENLILLCNYDQDVYKKMIEANVCEKLMELASSGNFNEMESSVLEKAVDDDEFKATLTGLEIVQVNVTKLAYCFALRIEKTKTLIAEKHLNDLLNLLLELMPYSSGRNVTVLLSLFYEVLYIHFWEDKDQIGSFSDQKIQFLYSQFDKAHNNLKFKLLVTFIILIYADGERLVPFLTDLGLIDKLIEFLENDLLVVFALRCLEYMVDNCFKGYEHVHSNANVVPKVLPFITSENEDIQRAATRVLTSLIDAKSDLMVPHLNHASFLQIVLNIEKFKLDDPSLSRNLINLSSQVLVDKSDGPKNSKQKLRRKR